MRELTWQELPRDVLQAVDAAIAGRFKTVLGQLPKTATTDDAIRVVRSGRLDTIMAAVDAGVASRKEIEAQRRDFAALVTRLVDARINAFISSANTPVRASAGR